MGQKSSKAPRVDPRYFAPQKLYCYSEVDLRKLRRLIKDNKLAPCFPGADSEDQELEDCPICFLGYPSLNRSVCCHKPICTECFLQVKSQQAGSCPKCPYCKADFSIYFHGPLTAEQKGKLREEEQRLAQAVKRAQQSMQNNQTNSEASAEQESGPSSIAAARGESFNISVPVNSHSTSSSHHSGHCLCSSPDANTPQAESIKPKPYWGQVVGHSGVLQNDQAIGPSTSCSNSAPLDAEDEQSPQASTSGLESHGHVQISVHQANEDAFFVGPAPSASPATSASSSAPASSFVPASSLAPASSSATAEAYPDRPASSTAQSADNPTVSSVSGQSSASRPTAPSNVRRWPSRLSSKALTLSAGRSGSNGRTSSRGRSGASDSLAGFLQYQGMLGHDSQQPQRPQPASGTHDLIVGMVTTDFTFVPDAANQFAACHGAVSGRLEQEDCATSDSDKATVTDGGRLEQEDCATGTSDKATVEDGVDMTDGAVLLQNPDGSLQYVVLTSDEQKAAQQKSQKAAAVNVQGQDSQHDQAVQAAIDAADARLRQMYNRGAEISYRGAANVAAAEPASRANEQPAEHIDPMLRRMEETDARLRALYSSPHVL